MKKGWEVKKLGEVCENLDNKRKPITKGSREEGDIPYYGASGIVDYVAGYLFDEDLLLVSEDGANLLMRTYPIAFSISGKTWVNNHAHVLRFSNKTIQAYIEYYLNSIDLSSYVSGMAQPKLNQAMLNSIQIPLPPLSEQKRIVSILDRAFAAIDKAKANTEKNLQNAKELFESYLQGIFSQHHGLNGLKDSTEKKSVQSAQSGKISDSDKWEEKKLSEVTTKIGSGATPSGGEKSYKKHGISLIRSLNVYDDGFRIKDLAYIDEIQASKLNGVTVEENDVLFNITGASVARCCIVPKEFLPARVNQHVAIIRSKKHILLPEFIRFSLISKENKDKLLKTGEQGATRQAITKVQLENFNLSFPKSLQEQEYIIKKIIAFKEKVTLMYFRYHQKLASLDDLKRSILQKAFAGQLSESRIFTD